jgi:hypothetical protein
VSPIGHIHSKKKLPHSFSVSIVTYLPQPPCEFLCAAPLSQCLTGAPHPSNPKLLLSTSSARHSPSSPPSTRGALLYSALLVESDRRRVRGGAQAQHAHGRPSARLQRRRRCGLRLRWIRDPDHRLLEGSTAPAPPPLVQSDKC